MAFRAAAPLGGPAARPLGPLLGSIVLSAAGLAALAASTYLAPTPAAAVMAAAGLAAPAAWLLWTYPELGLVLLSAAAAGLLPLSRPAADATALALVALVVARGLAGQRVELPRWPITGPLLAFAGCAAFSALYALVWQAVSPSFVLAELRPAAYAAVCAAVGSLLWRRGQLVRLAVGLYLVADLTAAAVILQQFKGGKALLLPGMEAGGWQIDALGGSATLFGGVRIVPPGHVLLFLLSIVAFCLLLSPLRSAARWACGLQFAFLNLALLLTYTRAQWIASVVALGLACLLMPATARRRLARLVFAALGPGVLVAGLAVAGLLGSGSRAGHGIDALFARASSLAAPGETLDSTSLQWRVFEIGEALKSIAEHPWLGVGLGNDYRPRTLLGGEARGDPRVTRFGGDTRLTRFMHNGYLYVATKAGLPALAVLGWFAVALLVVGGRAYVAAPDAPPKALALAVICTFAGFLEWTFFEPHLMLPPSMATIGMMVAVLGAFDRRSRAAPERSRSGDRPRAGADLNRRSAAEERRPSTSPLCNA